MSASGPKHEANPSRPSSSVREEPEPVRSPIFDPAEVLSRIWQQSLPLMQERVACLERSALGAAGGDLPPAARTEASDLAHKLAGSLGMFGYPEGTTIAREIEHMLESEGTPDGERFLKLTQQLRAVLPL